MPTLRLPVHTRSLLVFAGVGLAALLAASPSVASPVEYAFDSGFVTLTATVDGVAITDPVTAALDGGQVTIDEGVPTLTSLDLTASGPIDLAFSPAYLGFDQITIESLAISGTGGTLVPVTLGPPTTEYFFAVDPLNVDLVVSGTGSVDLVSAPVSGSAPATGSLFVTSSTPELSLSGITLAQIQPAGAGTAPLLLKADFVFSGSPIPEPHAAMLFAVGMTVVSAGRSGMRRRARRSGRP